jgi:hypothetical protein
MAAAQDSAAVYKWVDQDGTVNYGSQPPAGTSAEELPIRVRRGERAPTQARAKAQDDNPGLVDSLLGGDPTTTDDSPISDTNESPDERAQLVAQRQGNCKAAKDRMASYEQAKRIYKPGPAGERVYLTSDEIDAERATARVAVAEWCNE